MRTKFDNKVFVFLGCVVDVVWISIIWYISSILLITCGAASVAMYYMVHNRIFKSNGYLFQTYKRSFAENFKKATVIHIIFILIEAFLVADMMIVRMNADINGFFAAMYYPMLVFLVIVFMWQLSVTAYQARFEDSIKNILAKGAVIAASNIGWMLFLVLFLAGAIYLCRYLIFIVVILPGGYMCLVHHVFEHIYRKMGWIEESTDSVS